MNALPISFVLYTSTRGHFGRKTDWRLTLNHWDRQIPLAQFNLIAHLKISEEDEQLGAEMAAELKTRGFHVIETVGNWARGQDHQQNYMTDCIKVSKDPALYQRPYYLHVEDDSPVISETVSLEDLLLQSCQMLADNHELVTVRVMRQHDDRGPTEAHPTPDPRLFYSKDVNLQPLLMRSLDFYRLGLALEANPRACQYMQCERLWRVLLDTFSRSPFRHAVYEPTFARAAHIGIPQPEHELLCQSLHL